MSSYSFKKKRIEIKIVSSDQIEITNNFLVEMRAFSAEVKVRSLYEN